MKKKIKNKGRHARRKGHQFEREIAIKFRKIFPTARRHLEYQDGQAFGVDIAEVGPYRIQCKRLNKYASINTINEIQCDREMCGEVPVLITAGDDLPAMAVLPLDDLLQLIRIKHVGKPRFI